MGGRLVIRCVALVAGCAIASASGGVFASDPRLFGHYQGQATVTTSPFYPPGVYDAEAAVVQTASGLVGYVNIVFDPADTLGGTITHAFSARLAGPSRHVTLGYSDRMCGAGDPIDKCYPHSPSPEDHVQYSFTGVAAFVAGGLTLSSPAILPNLPYNADLPFDSVQMTRTRSELRTGFDGVYEDLRYIWMGTVLLPVPLPLFGSNRVTIENGEIVEWLGDGGVPVSVPGVVSAWCFDDTRGLGWMNQQNVWFYYWVLDPAGQGVGVIVTFDVDSPDCGNLQDPLAGDELDRVHGDLVGAMFELSAPVRGAGTAPGLRVGRNGDMLDLTWDPDCGMANRYAVYRGDLGAGYTSLTPEDCSVVGTDVALPLGAGSADFFLVVPNRQNREGSYGMNSLNVWRPAAGNACYPPGPVDSCAP